MNFIEKAKLLGLDFHQCSPRGLEDSRFYLEGDFTNIIVEEFTDYCTLKVVDHSFNLLFKRNYSADYILISDTVRLLAYLSELGAEIRSLIVTNLLDFEATGDTP